jgi:hypothetical protein
MSPTDQPKANLPQHAKTKRNDPSVHEKPDNLGNLEADQNTPPSRRKKKPQTP